MPNSTTFGRFVTRVIFPCEDRLNKKLDDHKREVQKLIDTIREKNSNGVQAFTKKSG